MINVYTQKQKEWDERFMSSTRKVKQEEIQTFEISEHYPYYAFVWNNSPYSKLSITFFTRKDQPFLPDPLAALGSYWYNIEPSRVDLANTMLSDLCPRLENRDGVEGFMIPLYESEQMSDMIDVNAYLRNLHFWESLIDTKEITPSELRMFWMARKRYGEVKDMSEMRVLYNMLSHMGGSKIDPERILQFRDFFTTNADERAKAVDRLKQMAHICSTESTNLQHKNEVNEQEADIYQIHLMNEFTKQMLEIQKMHMYLQSLEEKNNALMKEIHQQIECMQNAQTVDNYVEHNRIGNKKTGNRRTKNHDVQ